MKTNEQIRRELGRKILNLRSIERIIDTDRFNTIYHNSTENVRSQILKFIEQGNKDSLISLINTQLNEHHYEMMCMGELRKLGRRLCIPGYYALSKTTLLSEISKYASKQNVN